MNYRTRIAALALAAVAVFGTSVGVASTANAAPVSQQTTHFFFPSNTTASAELDVTNGDPIPAVGTAVTFDLQNFVSQASIVVNGTAGNAAPDTGNVLADDIESAALGLETTPYQVHTAFGTNTGTVVTGSGIPASDFSNLPSAVIPSTGAPSEVDPVFPTTHVNFMPQLSDNYNLPANDTTITLYVVSSTANSFQVSGTNGGAPLTFQDVQAIDPSLASSVTWGATTSTTGTGTTTPKHSTFPKSTSTVLFDGHGVSTAPTREQVVFQLKGKPSWVLFTIAGPGAINGHQGWVYAQPGANIGYYSGLEANHTYDVTYTPVTGQGSTTPAAGHGGTVTFISNA